MLAIGIDLEMSCHVISVWKLNSIEIKANLGFLCGDVVSNASQTPFHVLQLTTFLNDAHSSPVSRDSSSNPVPTLPSLHPSPSCRLCDDTPPPTITTEPTPSTPIASPSPESQQPPFVPKPVPEASTQD
ncbi:hypothetical protein L1887_22629 [Cichorium endivia]|nr:hypothetical protein L1887_22629 [Cichorium endivia]